MSAQTVPCAHQETGTLCPISPVSPPTSPVVVALALVGHTPGAGGL